MRVTAKKLEAKGAISDCSDLKWFKRRWPSGYDATLKNLEATAKKDTYLLGWLAYYYLDDPEFCTKLKIKEAELVDTWDSNIGKRYIDNARNCVGQFILGHRSQKQAIEYLRVYKRSYESARAYALVNIVHKLARMVYDKIKVGAAERGKAK